MGLTKEKLGELLKKQGINIPQEEECSLGNLIESIQGKVILLALSGSKAYGTDLPTSDFDFRGIFVMPTEEVLKANPTTDGLYPYIPQVNDATNDVTFFEIGRFIELLEKGNPNILELLNVPDDCIVYKDPKFDKYFPNKELFITKKLQHTFSGYAYTQIGKAKGLNKKIHNPQPKKRKEVLDFCYLVDGAQTKKLKDYYRKDWFKDCGVVKLPHGKGLYAVYFDIEQQYNFRGFLQKEGKGQPNQIRLSSIPKEATKHINPISFYFDLDGYQTHCKQHKEYWEWVEKRNPQRYKDNMKGEVGYDHKNMMHCVRLVEMAEDIVTKKEIVVKRPNREHLLSIRNGEHKYEDLLSYVENKVVTIKDSFEKSDLPEGVDRDFTRNLLQKIRIDNLPAIYIVGLDPITSQKNSIGVTIKE